MSQPDQPASSLAWCKNKTKVGDDDEDNRPAPRSSHTMTVVGTNAFLFGGMIDYNPDDTDEETKGVECAKSSNELFRLDISGKSVMEWHKMPLDEDQPAPLPRWKHSATLFDNTQILVFGGFHTTDHRLNDVWVFDAVGYTWTQPNAKHNKEAAVPFQLSNSFWANVPPARAAHTATLIDDTVYVFGGYGGLGYGRRDLDDLYALDVYSWTWTKLAPKGSLPEKRSGHQAVAIEKKIYVFGGSNSSTQFQDVYVLDTEQDPPVWSKLSSSLPIPSWNLAACSVIAIPTWKIFTFGGVTGVLSDADRQGKMVSTTSIMDTGIERWTEPKIDGKAPSPRCDTCLAYDPKGSRLLVFGGWADEWLGDLYTLDVGNIVGPPYAITDLYPNMGPITGGTDCTIIGIDFINTKNIVVRFGSARSAIDVPGVFLSQTKISCVSPNASKFPPGEVDVRISLEGDSFTTTSQKFSFFPVTNHATCIMYGPGLLSGCAIAEETSFMIQARDDNGVNRTTGGDEFSVVITMMEESEDAEPLRVGGVLVDDLENGTYHVSYIAKYVGKYTIDVDFMGTFGGKAGPLRGSGVSVQFSATAPRENNQMSGELVIQSLRNDIQFLAKFTDDISKNLLVRVRDDSWSNDEQIQVLMRIKEALLLIEGKGEDTSLLVDRSECTLNYLAEQHVVTEGLDDSLNASKFLWEKILREAPHIQNKIAPMMRAHSSKIKADIQSYEQHIIAYKKELANTEFYKYATGTKKALELLEAAEAVHKDEQATCERMSHIANIFELNKDMDLARRLMGEVEDLLTDFKVLWEVNLKVVSAVEDARKETWAMLDPEALEDSAKSCVQSLRKLPKTVRQSDAFQGMDRVVKEFMVTCPIIASLRSPAMRDRHWQELMGVVKKEFTLPSTQPTMALRDLLDLKLHKHAQEVDEITEKALKEAKHEDTLRSLEATWSAVNYTMTFYKDTDVPLLKMDDDIVEQLESDQMAVQSIVGSRYPHFKKEAAEWQRTLGLVSDVSQLLAELQRTWSYLEPLFIGSEEVRKELPEDAKRFQEIDSQVKSILQKAWKVRNVKATCVQPGLLDRLYELEANQDQCKKSLSDFLDGKRRQFPRFYFTSEADLLDILSNSSQPAKVLAQVDKILLATKELVIEQRPGDDRPHATHWVAGVGKEQVKFAPAVKLLGKAEQYLRALLEAQIYTLSECLAAAMARYPQTLRIDWVTKKDKDTGETLDPAQIILLVAAIDFVQQVEKSMASCSGGDPRSMIKCHDLTKSQLADLINLTQAPLSKADRQRVMCMITMDAHNRDILDVLLKEKALAPTDFQWQSKLRPQFFGDLGKSVTHIVSTARFNICDANFEYGFEYLGNGPRLVITPLTDRIYVTATQALHLKMGCAPAGEILENYFMWVIRVLLSVEMKFCLSPDPCSYILIFNLY